MSITACPTCGQMPTAYFDYVNHTVVSQHVCMTAGQLPPQ